MSANLEEVIRFGWEKESLMHISQQHGTRFQANTARNMSE